MEYNQALPSNPEAEDALIGTVLLDARIPDDARDASTTWFYNPSNRDIWAAFLEIEEEGKEIDQFEVLEVVKRNQPNTGLTAAAIAKRTTGLPHGINARTFVLKIKDAYNRRFAMKELDRAIQLLQKGDPDVLRNLKARIEGIESSTSGRGNWRKLSEIIEQEAIPGLHALAKGESGKIKTGWPEFDKLIGGGISISDIMLIAAPPGEGKSALVLQIARQVAQQGVGVGILAGEMSDKENVYRLISQAAGATNLNSLHHIAEIDRKFYFGWANAIKDLPLYFDSHTFDIQSVGRSLRYLAEDCGVKVLVFDYVQLFKVTKTDKFGRYERITEVSIEIKRLARQYGIAVIEVAQFTKDAMKNDLPKLTDLENGTQLIKDISLGIIIDRGPDKQAILRIEKGRNSGKATLSGTFDRPTLRFQF